MFFPPDDDSNGLQTFVHQVVALLALVRASLIFVARAVARRKMVWQWPAVAAIAAYAGAGVSGLATFGVARIMQRAETFGGSHHDATDTAAYAATVAVAGAMLGLAVAWLASRPPPESSAAPVATD